MKITPLPSQHDLHAMFDYQASTGLLIRRARPNADWRSLRFAGRPAGYTSKRGYVQVSVGDGLALAHRVIWKMVYGTEPAEIDHRDGNPSNNRLSNLREATRSQNLANRRKRHGKLLPKGVQATPHGRFRAEIHSNGKTMNLGSFRTPEDAARAFQAAACAMHGEFARAE